MFVCCECCVLSGRGLCDELITRPEESYRLWCVVVCDLETSWMRRPWPTGGLLRQKNSNKRPWNHDSTKYVCYKISEVLEVRLPWNKQLSYLEKTIYHQHCRLPLKCDGTCAETRFRLSAKRTSPFKSAWERQFSRLLAAEVCASAVLMLDTPCSEVVWRVLATHFIRQFPFHFPSRASPCAITFHLDSTSVTVVWSVSLADVLFNRGFRYCTWKEILVKYLSIC